MKQKQTVLLCPFNSAGHINNLLGIADRLKDDHDLRTIFIILGQPINNDIKYHGHEIISLNDTTVYEDYPIEECDSLMGPVTDEELKRKQFKEKKAFPGPKKWTQFFARYNRAYALEPIEACVKTVEFFHLVLEDMINYNGEYERLIAEIQPDLIINDLYNVYPAIARLKDIPWVQVISPNPFSLLRSKLPNKIKPPTNCGCTLWTKEERERIRREEPDRWQEIVYGWQDDNERVNQALENYVSGLEQLHAQYNLGKPEPQRPNLTSPYLNLYVFPKVLDYDKDDDIFEYDKYWLRYDSLIRKAPNGYNTESHRDWDEKINIAMKDKKELVYFSLGSLASAHVDLMNRLLDMLKTDQQRCYVVSKGANGHKINLDSSNMIGENYVPQTFILQRCNLAIIHGGTNSLTECLYYGVPTIVMPVFLDQFDNAQRVVDLGLGKKLMPRTCSRADLIGAINDMLSDESLMNRFKVISKEMRARDDSRKISAIFKKLMRDGKLDEKFIEECRKKDYEEINF